MNYLINIDLQVLSLHKGMFEIFKLKGQALRQ